MVKYEKSIYLGAAILDLSKTLMYDFHYNYMMRKYVDNAKLLMTDTDSLIYEIHTDDFYADITNDIDARFDTSDYSKDHPAVNVGFKVGANKKVIRMMKDEAAGKQIKEFIGLRSKLYSYITCEGDDVQKCKGVVKAVVKNSIKHEHYHKCLISNENQMWNMHVIRSHKHVVYSEEVNKCALSSNDDKRHICSDGISTLALGHFRIDKALVIN